MYQKRITLLCALVALGGLILVGGCTKTNHDPVISSITATPADNVLVNGTINLTATAADEDGDDLVFEWTVAGGGVLSQSTTSTVVWTAPATPCTATVTCLATDGSDGEATLTKTVYATVVWQAVDIQGYTAESTAIPAAATTYIPFVMEEPIPDNAILDSAFVTTDLEPDDTPNEFFTISVVTPSGSEVLVYDGLNGVPDVDDVLLQGIKGEPAKGNWRLKVVRGASTIERWAEECEVSVFIRYY
jgi:hypothetical protein